MLFLWNLSSNIWLLGSIWYDEAHAKYIWETICLSLSFCRRLGRQLAVSAEKPNTWHLMPGRGTAGAWTLLLLDLVSTAQLFLSVGISVWEKENHCLLWSKCLPFWHYPQSTHWSRYIFSPSEEMILYVSHSR